MLPTLSARPSRELAARPRLRLLLPLALLATVNTLSCKKRVCDSWKTWERDLPGVKSIDTCYNGEISGTTTATTEDFVKMFEAKGFAAGRSNNGTLRNSASWRLFQKADGPLSYKMSADVSSSFVISERPRTPTYDEWVPEATWASLGTAIADRAALLKKLEPSLTALDAAPKAPALCDAAALERDPKLAGRTSRFLFNLDAVASALADPAAKPSGMRGPDRLPPSRTQREQESEMVTSLLYERADLTEIASMRIVPAIKLTSYTAPTMSAFGNTGSFSGGRAKFVVAVIDLEERRVLCRSTGEAESSRSISATTEGGRTYASPDIDLAFNIEDAAFVALAKMNPVFTRSARK